MRLDTKTQDSGIVTLSAYPHTAYATAHKSYHLEADYANLSNMCEQLELALAASKGPHYRLDGCASINQD